jgi:hypothetical protein
VVTSMMTGCGVVVRQMTKPCWSLSVSEGWTSQARILMTCLADEALTHLLENGFKAKRSIVFSHGFDEGELARSLHRGRPAH